MISFRQKVIDSVKKIPKGMVASYGQVAAAAGNPRAPRQVGGILRSLDISAGKVPWWRVINSQGLISIKGNWTATKQLQADILRKEQVEVSKEFKVNMDKYRFHY